MAQRKAPPPAGGRGGSRPGGSAVGGAAGTRPPVKGARPAAGGKPPARKPGRSIVNQRQRPWGLIIIAVVIVLFAAGIVTYVAVNHKSTPAANGGCGQMVGSNPTSYLNELKCAQDIQGVVFKPEANRNHQTGTITYDTTPPIGGDHSPYWADCAGTVYTNAIANENAVHMLEHGAIWITYKPGLDSSEVTALAKLVNGQDHMAMSPYPGLDANISLQSWGYQLKVDSASDPRIQKFIDALRYNPKTTPEYGATCSQPTFKDHPSTFGTPLAQPAS